MPAVSRVATRIRTLRVERHLTQAALADHAGISREYLTRIEAARQNPTLRIVEKIAKALKVSVADLLN